MPRIVHLNADGPIRIDPAQFPRDEQGNLKPIWICACGLTTTPPICDGTHKTTCRKEEPGHMYRYDAATKAVIEKKPLE